MSQAFGNGKRNNSGTDHAKDLRHQHQYTFAKNLSKDRCGYVRNDTVNDQFTIRYDYLENQLISRVRNVKNYETLYSLAQGHNVCECLAVGGAGGSGGAGGGGGGFNVGGELYYRQEYSSQDLSGIEFYDSCGNKIFDSVLFDECSRKSYSVYDNVFTGTSRDKMYDKSQYMKGFNYPKQIPLHIEYANPSLVLYSPLPNVIYLRDIDVVKLGKVIEECYNLEEKIKDIRVQLFKRYVANIEYTETETIYTYDTIELGSNILGGNVISTVGEEGTVDDGLNLFTNLQVLKPDTFYYYKFTGSIVQDLTTDYFNVKGKLNNLVGDGFDNTILDNAIFTVEDVSGQGAVADGSQVVFKPDSIGDFYYQDGSNDNIRGLINVVEGAAGGSDACLNYIISFDGSNYYLDFSGAGAGAGGVSGAGVTIDMSFGDVVVFTLSGSLENHPLYIQSSYGAIDSTTEVEDASYILGVAGNGLSSVGLQIVDYANNLYSGADNEITVGLDPDTNTNFTPIFGTLTKAAVNGDVSFSDLRIDYPRTGYRLIFSNSTGDISGFLTPSFDVLGELTALHSTTKREFYVGEPITNFGVRLERAGINSYSQAIFELSGGDIDASYSYGVDFDKAIVGTNVFTLNKGSIFGDISINKVGNDYLIQYDMSNTTGPVISDNFRVFAKLDLSNSLAGDTSANISIPVGEDLSNYRIDLRDFYDNRLDIQGPAQVSLYQSGGVGADPCNNLIEVRTVDVVDGSLTMLDFSINNTGYDFFIHYDISHTDTSKNTDFFDVYGFIDLSNQPLKYANRIMADNFDRITVSVTDAFGNVRPVTSTLSMTLQGAGEGGGEGGAGEGGGGEGGGAYGAEGSEGARLVGETSTTTYGGVGEFRRFDIGGITLTEPMEFSVKIDGPYSENLNSIVTDSFIILYTNWDNAEVEQVLPGITTISGGDYLIPADAGFSAFDNSYVIVNGSDMSNNSYWKPNTTSNLNAFWMRTLAWDTSNGDAVAGGIYRAPRSETVGSHYTYDGCGYDFSFNTSLLTWEQHKSYAESVVYDASVYDASWTLTSVRTEAESDAIALAMKNNLDISGESMDYFIGGEMLIYDNIDPDYGHILYYWDISGERDKYIWTGGKTIIF